MATWAKGGLALAAVVMLAALLGAGSEPMAAPGKVTCDRNGKPVREGSRMCRQKKLWVCKKDALGIGQWEKTDIK